MSNTLTAISRPRETPTTPTIQSALEAAINDLCLSHDEAIYVQKHWHEYLRTLQDVVPRIRTNSSILEIGAFFGAVCVAFRKLCFRVTAADAPEFINRPEQIARFSKHQIKTAAVRLEDFILPFPDETFDAIIMCEVLEHLNFNPLPLLKEINRVGKQNSIFYLSLPNGANIYNRVDMMRGRDIGNLTETFFTQLLPDSDEPVYGHWREYTPLEVRRMLEPLGFRIDRHYYFSLGETLPSNSIRRMIARLIYETFPILKENQRVIATRNKRTDLVFHIPRTVHRSITKL